MNCSSGSGLTFYLLTSKERGRANLLSKEKYFPPLFYNHHGCTADAGRELHAAPVKPPARRSPRPGVLAPLAAPHAPPERKAGRAEKGARPPRPALTHRAGPRERPGSESPHPRRDPPPRPEHTPLPREGAGEGKDLPCSLATIKVAVS